jgi:hypothetical protein
MRLCCIFGMILSRVDLRVVSLNAGVWGFGRDMRLEQLFGLGF